MNGRKLFRKSKNGGFVLKCGQANLRPPSCFSRKNRRLANRVPAGVQFRFSAIRKPKVKSVPQCFRQYLDLRSELKYVAVHRDWRPIPKPEFANFFASFAFFSSR